MKTKFEKLHKAVHYAQNEILNQSEYNSATLCIKTNGDIYFIGLEYKNVIVCPGAFDFDSHYFKIVLSENPNHCVANCYFGYDTMSFICKNNLSSIFI